jgi:hypothetical protein
MAKRKAPAAPAQPSVAEQKLDTGRRALRDGDMVHAAQLQEELLAAGAIEQAGALHDAIVRARIFKTIDQER